jgi:hypothetical protein
LASFLLFTFIIVIISHTVYPTAVQPVLKTVPVSLIHNSATNFRTTRHELSITAFCIRIYRAGRTVSSLW